MTHELIKTAPHIPLEEMLSDLEVTKKELSQFQNENSILSKDYSRNKLAIYLNEGRIIQRKEFISKLEQLIKSTYPLYEDTVKNI